MPDSYPRRTGLLRRWREDGGSLDDRRAVERELRRIAARYMRRQPAGHPLQPTTLVNEVYLRLVEGDVACESRSHFYRIAARVMRQILVDHARKRRPVNRGAGRRVD